MSIQVTILGLRQIGTSIGLALAKIKDQVVRVGNDREIITARQAEKMGAVDKITVNLPSAVRDADVVILAVPVNEIRGILEVIAPDLKSGSVLIDTSPIKETVAQWAKELLPPEDRYLIGLTPSLNPAYLMETGDNPETARADLFKNGLILINSVPGIDESAIELVINLVRILEAKPLFVDTAEADGLAACSIILPRLAALALANATTDQPGWREARKVAGPDYAFSTEPALYAGDMAQTALFNQANALRMLDAMIWELRDLRKMVAEGKVEALEERLAHAQEARERWWAERQQGEWEPGAQGPEAPTKGEMFSKLFGIRTRREKKS